MILAICFVLCFTTSTVTAAFYDQNTPEDQKWIETSGVWYRFVDEAKKFSDANRYCKSLFGATLTTVVNDSELKLLTNILKKYITRKKKERPKVTEVSAWIGLQRHRGSVDPHFIAELEKYLSYPRDFPYHFQGSEDDAKDIEDSNMELIYYQRGIDSFNLRTDLDHKNMFFCKTFGVGWIAGYNRDYLVSPFNSNHNDAKSICELYGGQLMFLETEKKDAELYKLVVEFGKNRTHWLGMNTDSPDSVRTISEGQWLDESKSSYHKQITKDMGGLFSSPNGYACLAAIIENGSTALRWQRCTRNQPFICQKKRYWYAPTNTDRQYFYMHHKGIYPDAERYCARQEASVATFYTTESVRWLMDFVCAQAGGDEFKVNLGVDGNQCSTAHWSRGTAYDDVIVTPAVYYCYMSTSVGINFVCEAKHRGPPIAVIGLSNMEESMAACSRARVRATAAPGL